MTRSVLAKPCSPCTARKAPISMALAQQVADHIIVTPDQADTIEPVISEVIV